MDVFKRLPDLAYSKLHQKFNLLRDAPYYYGARKIVEEWAHDFHDKDGKIVKEFQTTFHSSFWGFYLHAMLKELNFNISNQHNRPDYIVIGLEEFYIEAVVSNIKDIKKGGRPESERTLDDHLSMLSPISSNQEFSELIDEAIVRHSNSISEKLKKYTRYEKDGKKYFG